MGIAFTSGTVHRGAGQPDTDRLFRDCYTEPTDHGRLAQRLGLLHRVHIAGFS